MTWIQVESQKTAPNQTNPIRRQTTCLEVRGIKGVKLNAGRSREFERQVEAICACREVDLALEEGRYRATHC